MVEHKQSEFFVSVQIDPPEEVNSIPRVGEKIRSLHAAGARVFDINSSKRFSHDPVMLAIALQRLVPTATYIPHITTRDIDPRQVPKILYSAYEIAGITTSLLLTGDPYLGEVESELNVLSALREVTERLQITKSPLPLVLCAAVNQHSSRPRYEKDRVKKKVDAGAQVFMSQPVFDHQQLDALLEFYDDTKKPLVVGVWPLMLLRTIENIAKGNITGVTLPSSVYGRLKRYESDPESLKQVACNDALELLTILRANSRVQGAYIVAPYRDPTALLPIISQFCV